MNRKVFTYGYLTGIVFIAVAVVVGYRIVFKTNEITVKDIAMIDMNNHPISLKTYEGKPLVINLWGTHCAPCIKELPSFVNLQTKYKNEVNFIFVSDEDVDVIKKFIQKKNYDLFFAKSIKHFSRAELNYYIPTTLFYDDKGELIEEINGEASLSEFESKIKLLLNK